ncbi:hypothetical protein ACCAA_510007 [Candidatus Accumulibacter aalborgensis]|uniref:Uncharacterized protein n=1 Tax=Candidatus Accumulibacter aalborgensis TaxID=1860102 RepID=A0A1A8XS79_9PROT|nr:hypothetical protein ACCAA_510007 [Candidatus Accumulibacter aalborgensis]
MTAPRDLGNCLFSLNGGVTLAANLRYGQLLFANGLPCLSKSINDDLFAPRQLACR